MKITEQPISLDNVFEQMALMTKRKLVEQGFLPADADRISIDFVKEKGIKVIENVVKNEKGC